MRRTAILLSILCFGSVPSVLAQHVEVGVAVAAARPHQSSWNTHLVPVVRLAPKKGWGVAGALNWFRADLDQLGLPDGTVTVRPLMAGYGYTWHVHDTFTTVSLVGGPAWNTLEGQGLSRHDVSFAVRPSASTTIPFAPRLGATLFAGYLWNHPHFSGPAIPALDDRWNTNAFVVSGGIVVRVF